MELRLYWRTIRRRLWMVILLPLVVLGISLALRGPAAPRYEATVRLIVDVPLLPVQEGMSFDPRESAAQAAEFLVDDFSQFVTGDAVAASVSARLGDQGVQVPPGVIRGTGSSEKIHRTVTLTVVWHDPDEALAISRAVVEALKEESPRYFARLGGLEPQISVFDGPRVARLAPSLWQQLDLPLRVLLALLVGLGLAFLLHYLDDRIREPADLEALGLPVLGEIPGGGTRWRPWRRKPLP